MSQSSSLLSLIKVAWDPSAIVLMLVLACAVCSEPFDGPEIVLAIVAFSLNFPSRMPLFDTPRRLLSEILTGWGAIILILLAVGFGTRYLENFDKNMLIVWILLVPTTLFLSRLLMPAILPRLLAIEGVRTTVVIGASRHGQRLAAELSSLGKFGTVFVGFFDDRELTRLPGVDSDHYLGTIAQAPDFARARKVDAIFIAIPIASQPRILDVLEELRDSTTSIYFVPDIFVFELIQSRITEIGGLPVVALCESPFYGIDGAIKRISDLVMASAFLILSSPLMIAIAVAVKLSSPGPIFFRQRRYGLDGREITVYKFRSMTVCEDGKTIAQTRRGDTRVTRLGGFLRRHSLDELPQFINVLQGRMSVVGPRPHAVAHNEQYRKLIRGYMLRHKVRPGITGLAQVSGYRGETDTIDKMERRIECDLDYLRRWSVYLDLQIVFRTVWVLIKDSKAY